MEKNKKNKKQWEDQSGGSSGEERVGGGEGVRGGEGLGGWGRG